MSHGINHKTKNSFLHDLELKYMRRGITHIFIYIRTHTHTKVSHLNASYVICKYFNKSCRTYKLTKQIKFYPPPLRTAVHEMGDHIYIYTYTHSYESVTFECIVCHT